MSKQNISCRYDFLLTMSRLNQWHHWFNGIVYIEISSKDILMIKWYYDQRTSIFMTKLTSFSTHQSFYIMSYFNIKDGRQGVFEADMIRQILQTVKTSWLKLLEILKTPETWVKRMIYESTNLPDFCAVNAQRAPYRSVQDGSIICNIFRYNFCFGIGISHFKKSKLSK